MGGCVSQICRTTGTAVCVLRVTTVRLHYNLSRLSDMHKLFKVFNHHCYMYFCVFQAITVRIDSMCVPASLV